MFFKRKSKDNDDAKIKREADKEVQRRELERKRALYQEAMMALSAYGAWAHPADIR